MKKLLAFLVFVVVFSASALAEDFIKFSLYDEIAWPKLNSTNVVLGLIDANTPTVHGVSWVLFSSRVEEMYGLSSGFIYARAYDMRGVQSAIYNVTEEGYGLSSGIVDVSNKYFAGLKSAFINLGDEVVGVQYGFYNQAERFTGLQLGFVNIVEYMDGGIQIGLVNIIKNNGWLPAMIIINGKF